LRLHVWSSSDRTGLREFEHRRSALVFEIPIDGAAGPAVDAVVAGYGIRGFGVRSVKRQFVVPDRQRMRHWHRIVLAEMVDLAPSTVILQT